MTETGRKVNIAGIDIDVVSDEEAEQADAVVCMPATFKPPFKDNLRGKCSKCGQKIIFRPHVPMTVPKLCITCAVPIMAPAAGSA